MTDELIDCGRFDSADDIFDSSGVRFEDDVRDFSGTRIEDDVRVSIESVTRVWGRSGNVQ